MLGLDVAGPAWLLVAGRRASTPLLGTALGLFVSAFARSEFQAVQFLPAFVLPQFLLCGLLTPRDALPDVLRAVSDVLPLSYAVDAMRDAQHHADAAATSWAGRAGRARFRRRRDRARRGDPAPAHRLRRALRPGGR